LLRRARPIGVMLALVLAVAAAGCGGARTPAATTARAQAATGATDAERRWQREVERFAAGLLPEFRRLQQLTGGGGKRGIVGGRLDPRIFDPGHERRRFVTTMAALPRCNRTLDATVPRAPTRRLRPVRVALVHVCNALADVPRLIRADVLGARDPTEVDRELFAAAARRAQDAARLVVDGLTTLRRVLASRS
jgi:hypothetical protein